MTGRWLTLNQARIRLGVTWPQLNDLIRNGPLTHELIGDHYSIAEESVSELATSRGDVLAEHADKPTVGRWSRAEDPDAFDDRADHDTPNDEGDDQQ